MRTGPAPPGSSGAPTLAEAQDTLLFCAVTCSSSHRSLLLAPSLQQSLAPGEGAPATLGVALPPLCPSHRELRRADPSAPRKA